MASFFDNALGLLTASSGTDTGSGMTFSALPLLGGMDMPRLVLVQLGIAPEEVVIRADPLGLAIQRLGHLLLHRLRPMLHSAGV